MIVRVFYNEAGELVAQGIGETEVSGCEWGEVEAGFYPLDLTQYQMLDGQIVPVTN